MVSGISVKQQVWVGLCTALLVIFAQISMPIPFSVVPITFQTFAVILIAIILEQRLAIWTIGVYILLGCIGLPVFSAFSGGLSKVFGPTGGFITGFIVMAWMIGWEARKGNQAHLWLVTYMGLFIDYLIGVLQLAFVTHIPFKEAILVGALPFVPKDIVLAAMAIIVANRIKGIIKKVGLSDIRV